MDTIDVADAFGARGEVGEIRSVVRLGEDRCRQNFTRCELRQQALLLLFRSGKADELAGDLGARAERTDTDVAARQLFRDDTHRLGAHLRAAERGRRGEAEHPELAEFGDGVDRNELVVVVPGRRERCDLLVRERPELAADQGGGLVVGVAGIDDGGRSGLAQQSNQLGSCADAHRAQRCDIGVVQKCTRRLREPVAIRADDLVLRHGDAVADLREIFAKADLQQQRRQPPEHAFLVEILRPRERRVQDLQIRHHPGQAVRFGLVPVECSHVERPVALAERDNLLLDLLDEGGRRAKRARGLGDCVACGGSRLGT
jgi:hypothetical protein